MPEKNYPKWIDEFEKSLICFLQGMDIRTFKPLPVFYFHPLYSDLWLDKLYRSVATSEKISYKKVLNSLPPPSSIRGMMEFIVTHSLNLKKSKKEYDFNKTKKIMDFFTKALKNINQKDCFGYKKNIILNKKELEKLIEKIKWQKGNREISRNLGKLFLGSMHFVNALYNDWCTDNGVDVFGPYQVSKYFGSNTILVIRHFPNLKPWQVWPWTKNLKHKEINIYTVYKNIKFEMDFVGVHTIYKGNLAKNLVSYALEVDGEFKNSLKEIKKISQYYLKLAEKQQNKMETLNFESIKQKILEQEYFQLKDFFKLVGQNDKPSLEIKKRVKNKKLIKNLYPLETYKLSNREISEKFGINFLKKIYKK